MNTENPNDFEILEIRAVDIAHVGNYDSSFWYEPILLNSEWLNNLGAKGKINHFYIPVTNLKAELHFEIFPNRNEILTTLKTNYSDMILDRIKYVHELQNLYFALAKTELEYANSTK